MTTGKRSHPVVPLEPELPTPSLEAVVEGLTQAVILLNKDLIDLRQKLLDMHPLPPLPPS